MESLETFAWSRLISGRGGRMGDVEDEIWEDDWERSAESGETSAIGMTFVPSVPAVRMDVLSSKGFEVREPLCEL